MRNKGISIAIVILLISAVAVAANTLGIADKRQVTFSDPVRIGNTLLPAGDYTVLHQMQGDEHIMVFTQMGKKKPAEARVKCTLVPLNARAANTELGYRINAAKEHVLYRMVFQGDRAEHQF